MAEVSVPVSEIVRAFGGAPTSLWNAYLWNAFKWGEGTASMVIGAYVGVSETEAATSDVSIFSSIDVSESQAVVGTMVSGFIRDDAGYYRMFSNDTADGEQRDTPSWAAGSTTTPTWASAAASATSWS
ncbi:MAG: hypothetical protein V4750_02740 [Pseudomonadota bacterium]